MMNWYLLKKYFYFSGRASRKEYWLFRLYNLFFITNAIIIDNTLIRGVIVGPLGICSLLCLLVIIIPFLAIAIRRLHDVGKSGWMVLIELIPIIGNIWFLVLTCSPGDLEDNQYGTSPKEIQAGTLINKNTINPSIFISLAWSFSSFILIVIIPRFANLLNFNIFSTNFFEFVSILTGSTGLIIPICLAHLVKNKSTQLALYIFATTLMVFTLYDTINTWYVAY
jgi:uncharacterized membrane protein YhaH (DUF805 family)